jgi:hypothetical protein
MAYVPETAMWAAISLHRAIPSAANNYLRQFSGGQLVLAFTLAKCVCYVCHALEYAITCTGAL